MLIIQYLYQNRSMRYTLDMNKYKNLIPINKAYWVFVGVSCFALCYHLLIITQVVPYANAWGGRLPSLQAMYAFEAFSFINQLFFIGLAYAKYKNIGNRNVQRSLSIILYIIFVLLLLNTLGNIFSKSTFEAVFFTPITLVMSLMALRLALE